MNNLREGLQMKPNSFSLSPHISNMDVVLYHPIINCSRCHNNGVLLDGKRSPLSKDAATSDIET